jgi:hypothetical protein
MAGEPFTCVPIAYGSLMLYAVILATYWPLGELNQVQLAIVIKHMCVVALTASIAACNIKLVDDPSAVRRECDTEQIVIAPVHQQRVFWGRYVRRNA